MLHSFLWYTSLNLHALVERHGRTKQFSSHSICDTVYCERVVQFLLIFQCYAIGITIEEKLIESVCPPKQLYDTSHGDYMKAILKIDLWDKISNLIWNSDVRTNSPWLFLFFKYVFFHIGVFCYDIEYKSKISSISLPESDSELRSKSLINLTIIRMTSFKDDTKLHSNVTWVT